jgi:hypothetical protein
MGDRDVTRYRQWTCMRAGCGESRGWQLLGRGGGCVAVMCGETWGRKGAASEASEVPDLNVPRVCCCGR